MNLSYLKHTVSPPINARAHIFQRSAEERLLDETVYGMGDVCNFNIIRKSSYGIPT